MHPLRHRVSLFHAAFAREVCWYVAPAFGASTRLYLGAEVEPRRNTSIVVAAYLRRGTRLRDQAVGDLFAYSDAGDDADPVSALRTVPTLQAGVGVVLNFSPVYFRTLFRFAKDGELPEAD